MKNIILTSILVIVISFFVAKYIKSCVPIKKNVQVVIDRLNKELICLEDERSITKDEVMIAWIEKREEQVKSLIKQFTGQ